jgi:hypothetical protein
MAAPAILKIDILADASKANAALSGVATTGKNKLGGLAKLAGGALATTAVVNFGTAPVTAATDAAVASERLQAVFKATGDTTGKAAKQAEDYASSLSKKIGVDDDSIIAAQAQLATFSAVSDETARSAGIFDDATAAAADLAAAGFGTLDSNSVQLGKALQDPVKGLAALSKSGVTFTDSQKEQIKALQESGDLLGAQKIVLKAVEDQVGGTAEATVTSQDKMTVAFGEVQESVGNALLPVLEKLAPILETIAGFVEDNITWLLPLAGALGVLAVAWQVATIASTLFGISMAAAFWPILAIIAGVAALIAIGVILVKNWDTIKKAFQAVFDWVKKNWPLILAILTGPIGLAVLAIVRNWDTIKNAVKGVFDWIKGAASDVWEWVVDKFNAIKDAIVDAFSGIADIIKRPLNAVIDMLNRFEVPKVTIGGGDPLGPFGPSLPEVTIGGWGLPHIPRLATGGSVLQTGLAVVHRGETFSGVGNTMGSATVINLTVTAAGLGADSPEIQRAVVKALRGYVGRNGPLPIPIRTVA